MRRMLKESGIYLAGVLTLPVLIGTLSVLSHWSLAKDPPKPFQRAEGRAVPYPADDGLAQNEKAFGGGEDNIGLDRRQLVPATRPQNEGAGGAVLFDEPVADRPAWLVGPRCPLPVHQEMLALQTPDEAEARKTDELREQLQVVIKEKASLLNATALAAEIELHRRQIDELKALKELQQLQKSLEELSDKFPDSDAGKRAREVLHLLKNAGPQPTLRPDADVFDTPLRPTRVSPIEDRFDNSVPVRKRSAPERDVGGAPPG